MRTLGRALLAGAAVAVLASSQAFAATIVVTPEDSIQDAIDAAVTGDTIKLLNGRYNQDFVVNKTIKVQGESRTGVIIDGTGLGESPIHVDGPGAFAVVKNLTVLFSEDDGVEADAFASVSLESLTIKASRENGIRVNGSGSVTVVVKSAILRAQDDYGISVSASNGAVTLTGNKVYRSYGASDCYASFVLAKSGTAEDVDYGWEFDGQTGILETLNARRCDSDGVDIELESFSLTKGTIRSSDSGVDAYDGYGPSSISKVSFKKIWGIAIDFEGSNCTITENKMDLVSDGIEVGGGDVLVSLNVVKTGGYGMWVNANGVTITGNTFKNLIDGGIQVQGGYDVHVDANTLTEVSGGGRAAIFAVNSENLQVSRNIIGDVDGGHGIQVDDCSYARIGGFVGEYSGANVVTNCQYSGIYLGYVFAGDDEYEDSGEPNYYAPWVSQNTVVGCGDLDRGGIHVFNTDGAYVYANTVTGSAGSGIVVGLDSDYAVILGNLISDSGTNGILVLAGYDSVCAGDYWECYYYDEFVYVDTAFGVVLEDNNISYSGSEGIDNGGNYTTITGNVVASSGIYDFVVGGTVNTSASVLNLPQPSDWGTVPVPAQTDYYSEIPE